MIILMPQRLFLVLLRIFIIKAFKDLIAFNTKLSYSNMETTLMLLMLYEASSL